MNTNYKRGQRKEYKIMHKERGDNKIVLRSAGSHSPIDVISIDLAERVIKFIQSKPDDYPEKERLKLLDENSRLNGQFYCKFEVR